MAIYDKTFPRVCKKIIRVIFWCTFVPFIICFFVLTALLFPLAIVLYFPTLGHSWGLVRFAKAELGGNGNSTSFDRFMTKVIDWIEL
jgi:hypothetical protein